MKLTTMSCCNALCYEVNSLSTTGTCGHIIELRVSINSHMHIMCSVDLVQRVVTVL